MSDMKLIMENWKGFVNEQFEACDTTFTIGDLMVATDIASVFDDEEKRRAKVQQLKNEPKLKKFLRGALKIAPAMAGLGLAIATTVGTGGIGGPAVAGAAAALTTAVGYKDLAKQGGEVFSKIFVGANKKEGAISPKARQFLETFCVDAETLDMIDDKYQKAYFEDSDIIDKIKEFFANNPPETRIPDLTDHLIDWMNTKSSYAGSKFTHITMEK